MSEIEFFCWTVTIVFIAWITVGVVSAQLALEILYIRIDPERYGIVQVGADAKWVIWNSHEFRLVFSRNNETRKKFPFGRFVPVSQALEPDDYLGPELGPIEKLFGIRFIGFPGIHKLYDPQLSWVGVDDNGLPKPHTSERRYQFSITSPFVIALPNLRLGGDSDNSTASKDDDAPQRFPLTPRWIVQTWAEDPVGSLFGTNWLPQMMARLKLLVQPIMGRMSLDEFIILKTRENNPLNTVLADASLGVWGRRINVAESSYEDFDFTNDEDGSIRDAVIAEAVGVMIAKKTAAMSKAGRAGDVALIEEVGKIVKELTSAGVDPAVIKEAVQQTLQSIGISGYKGSGTVVVGSGTVASVGGK